MTQARHASTTLGALEDGAASHAHCAGFVHAATSCITVCQVRLGVFGSECEAARAYDMAALVMDGFKADTNVSPWAG